MKKIAILFLCLFFMCSFAVPAFAAESVSSWLDSAREENRDKIENLEKSLSENYDDCEMTSYPMYHIIDDTFYEKISLFNGIDKFISKNYDIVTFILPNEKTDDFFCNFLWATGNDNLLPSGTNSEKQVVPKEFMLFIENVDADIASEKFGKVKNVSLLLADFVNFKLSGEGDTTSLIITFAYIESEKGEFLVPYTLLQTKGELIFEDGKIYTLKECTTIMKKSISFSEYSRTESTNILYPWQIALIIVVSAAALAGAFFGIKALIERRKTRVNMRYDF